MSDIAPIGRTPQTTPAAAAYRAQTAPQTGPTRGADQAQFSESAKWLSKMQQLPEVRQDLVDRVKSELEAGTYETEQKINDAADNLSEELF